MRQGSSLIPRENLFSAQFPPVKGPPGLASPFLELLMDASWSVCCDLARQCFVNVTDSLHRDGCLMFPAEKERDPKTNLQFQRYPIMHGSFYFHGDKFYCSIRNFRMELTHIRLINELVAYSNDKFD